MTLLYVPAGEFIMGSDNGDDDNDEKPIHTVYLDAFWIDQTDVTNAMFQKFVDATGYKTDAEKQGSGYVYDLKVQQWDDSKDADWQHLRGPDSNLNGLDDHPAVQVSWNDATAYCQWAGRRLPIEAEWEKAARGIDGRIYPWGSQMPDSSRLNYNMNVKNTTSVGKYPDGASLYGALDMVGNVWQWTQDWYTDTYYINSPSRNPTGPTSGNKRVLRGSSWLNDAAHVRASVRHSDGASGRGNDYGFRCVRSGTLNLNSETTASVIPPSARPSPTIMPIVPRSTLIPGISSTQISTKDGMTLLYVPAGEFLMGAASSDTQASAGEKPQHTVYLGAFWIDRTEVTNAMFKKFIDASNYQTDAEKQGSGYAFDATAKTWSDTKGADWQHPRGPDSNLNGLDNHPVVQVSWNDATAYCQWAGGDLPTEAQWEKAARGTDGRIYPWGNQAVAGNLLNFADRNLNVDWADKTVDDGYQFTSPVGHYPDGKSSYGTLDMAGNVWEWARDWYAEKYYDTSPARNPENTTRGDYRVLRGGAWLNDAPSVRASNRGRVALVNRYNDIGFRCVR